ncbi:mucin-5B [Microcaecilia unicolor]|uniref:Mucin-5B-like n=1 Tax=Microcaecilia unicolor TaxID=1415580 RepID=A0A6P7XZK9_9AMPH|nr:mucin-5B-like [Microcaecilia unicolor]
MSDVPCGTTIPTSIKQTTFSASTVCDVQCEWTTWFDVDSPSPGVPGGDYETYNSLIAAGKPICRNPEHIQCRAKNFPDVSIEKIGQVVQCDISFGLVCKNEDQPGWNKLCYDYEIRLLCCDDSAHCKTTTPSTTITTPAVTSTPCVHELCEWTKWYDVSYPQLQPGSGEFESLENIKAKGYALCRAPRDIKCRSVSFPDKPLNQLNQKVVCNKQHGLICRNRDQFPPICLNYEIQILCCSDVPCGTTIPTSIKQTTFSASTVCDVQCEWTAWFDVDSPSPGVSGGDYETYNSLIAAGKPICRNPEHIQCRAKNFPEVSIEKIGQVVQCDIYFGLVCKNEDQPGRNKLCYDYEIRLLCCDDSAHCKTTVTSTTITPTVTLEPCFCQFDGIFFSPGDVMYNVTDSAGCVVYAICSEKCEAERYLGPCISTTTTSTEKQQEPTSPITQNHSKCLNATCMDNGNIIYEYVTCPPVIDIICASGLPPKKIYDEEGCCYQYECEYCVGPNGEPKLPGEMWNSNCQECICNEDYTVHCKQVICTNPIKEFCNKKGFEPIQVLLPDDPCCPRTDCRCNPLLCSKVIKKCKPGFELTSGNYIDGCCIDLACKPKSVCVVDGNEYMPGATIPSSDACKTCYCTSEKDPKTQLNLAICSSISCKICALGYEHQPKPGTCCGECVQVACVIKTRDDNIEVLKPGEKWYYPTSNCSYYKCEQIETQFVTAVMKKTCPIIEPKDCESGMIQSTPDGCCKTCKAPRSCGVRNDSILIQRGSCQNTVTFTYCEGVCRSSSTFEKEKEKLAHKCTCCQELKSSYRQVQLFCPNGRTMNYKYTYVESCGCVHNVCVPLENLPGKE